MSKKLTGYREITPYGLTTGAAVIFKNFDIATDTVETAKAKALSATSGGVAVAIEYPNAWDREIDGVPANSIGMREKEEVLPTFKATLVEMANAEVLASALGGATVEDATGKTGYKLVVPKHDLDESDYLQNLTAITQTKKGEPLIIQILNPLSTEGFEFATESKAGGGAEVTFTGNYNPLDINDIPIKFFVPVAADAE